MMVGFWELISLHLLASRCHSGYQYSVDTTLRAPMRVVFMCPAVPVTFGNDWP